MTNYGIEMTVDGQKPVLDNSIERVVATLVKESTLDSKDGPGSGSKLEQALVFRVDCYRCS